MGLIHWIEAIVIIIVAVVVVSAIAVEILFPGALSLITGSVSAYFSSASSNSSFASPGINFSYPSNWVSLNPQILSSAAAKIIPMFGNYSLNQSIGSIGVLFPASFITSFSGFMLTLLSHAGGNLSGIKLPSNLAVVIAGSTKIADHDINLSGALSELSKSGVIHNISLSGVRGLGTSITNDTIAGLHLAIGELKIAQINGSVCFVFGAALSNSTASILNNSFNRVSGSINCSFSQTGTGLAESLLSHIMPNITK
jgi:hypothetical protein